MFNPNYIRTGYPKDSCSKFRQFIANKEAAPYKWNYLGLWHVACNHINCFYFSDEKFNYLHLSLRNIEG
jgi:hypothetical protein